MTIVAVNIHEVDEDFIATHKYMWAVDADGEVRDDLFDTWTISAPYSQPSLPVKPMLGPQPPRTTFVRVTEETRGNLNSFDDGVKWEYYTLDNKD